MFLAHPAGRSHGSAVATASASFFPLADCMFLWQQHPLQRSDCLGQREKSSSRFFLPSFFKFFSPRISKFFLYLLPLYFLDLYFPLLLVNHILRVDNFSYQIVSVYITFVVSFDWIPSQFLQNLWF